MRLYEFGHSLRKFRILTRATTKKWVVQKTRRLATAASLPVERYDITCGISGQITVELYNALLLRSSPKIPLVIYLPPYPSSPLPPSWLLNSYPVLNIPYRWSHNPSMSFRNQKSHAFPIPLHDTLQAYSWLLNVYLPSLSPEPKPLNSTYVYTEPKPTQRPLLIYGSYLGGTLATSLALTESFISSFLPTKIHSLIVHNGIFDWTHISTTPDPSIFPSSLPDSSSPNPPLSHLSTPELYTQSPWTTHTLHALKTRLFPSPSQTFDPFASPILFFRKAGIQVPKRWAIPPPPTSSSKSPSPPPTSFSDPETDFMEPDDFIPYPEFTLPDLSSPPPEQEEEEELHEPLFNERKSHLLFPSPKSSLQIPRSLFTYSATPTHYTPPLQTTLQSPDEEIEKIPENIFKTQAQELTQLMRRSIMKYELKERVLWDESCDAKEIAGERVREVEMEMEIQGESEGGNKDWERESIVRGWIEEGGL